LKERKTEFWWEYFPKHSNTNLHLDEIIGEHVLHFKNIDDVWEIT